MDIVEENIKYTRNNWTKYLRHMGYFLFTEKGHYYFLYNYLKKHLRINLKKNMTLIDIGFGSGFNIRRISKKYNIKTIGLDIVDETIELYNRQKIKNSCAKKIDPYKNNIPLKKESVDFVICSHILEHVPDDKHLLKETYRVLKKNSLVFFNIPINEEYLEIPSHLRKYIPKGFKKLIQNYKFEVIAEYTYDYYSLIIDNLGLKRTFFSNIFKKLLILLLSVLPTRFAVTNNLFFQKAGQYTIIAKKS